MSAGILKRIGFLAVFLSSLSVFAAESRELTFYVYDSFFSGGARPKLDQRIREKTGHTVKWISVGDGAQLVSRYKLDRQRGVAKANALIGLDQVTFAALTTKEFLPLTEKEIPELAQLEKHLRLAPEFVPFNFGVLALMVDTQKLPEKSWPRSWKDLLKPELRKKLLLQDPRTSTPGLGFVLGSREVFAKPEEFKDFWKKLRDQWLTLSPGWTQAYGLFQKGEVPLVWSYTTSQAYHQRMENSLTHYRAIVFEEGNPEQIEGAAVPADAPGGEAARKATLAALGVLLSEETQKEIPTAQWMFPARRGIAFPWGALKPPLPEPKKVLKVRTSPADVQATLKLWSEALR